MNILIIDDENTSRMTMKSVFVKYGSCATFSTGTEAIEEYKKVLIKGSKFDLIILDIFLEDENGVDVLKKIRKLEKTVKMSKKTRSRIIMATGNKDMDIVKECIKEGCDDYIVKPLRAKVVAPKMKKYNFQLLEK